MSTAISWVFEAAVKPDGVGEYRVLVAEISADNEANEPDQQIFESYIDDHDVHIYERYTDSAFVHDFHVTGKNNVMTTDSFFNCRDVVPSEIEQYHARLIYARPRGNKSPDRDPGGFTLGFHGDDLERPPARP